jgi:TM2 domain-containing membrane protein YozV
MNDDTTRTDSWNTSETPGSAQESATPNDAQRVGFCQDCGQPLTKETLRTVSTGVFCEPCLTARVSATTQMPGYTAVPPYATAPPQAAVAGDPSPVLATILGFIPGVGAMYNGQFAKGIVHLIIFGFLVWLSDNVNDIFGLFVAGWIFYMAFEAYHTAVARRDGLPLPNAFGFNDLGERLGFGKTWSPAHPAASAAPQAPANPAQSANPAWPSGYPPVNPVPVGTAPDWVGYVPPTAFAGPSPTPRPSEPVATAQPGAPWGHAPYAETFTGTEQAYRTDPGYSAAVPPMAMPPVDLPARRFPAGALWLIGLGILILVANLLPDWKLTERWWPPVFFAGLSIWLFMRRLHAGARMVCIIRWPVLLMVLAVILALHAAYLPVTFGLAFSVLLIAFGGLLFLERTAGATTGYAPPVATAAYPGTPSIVDAQAEEARSRAAWAAADTPSTGNDPDATKGGQ